jgi:hypothetical protein
LAIDTFPDDYELINNQYILVIDERSVKDRMVILAEIPRQIEFNNEKVVVKRERRFKRREEYVLDPTGWYGDQREEEIKVVRVRVEDASFANMLDDGHEPIGVLAMYTYGTDGVFEGGASYPDILW